MNSKRKSFITFLVLIMSAMLMLSACTNGSSTNNGSASSSGSSSGAKSASGKSGSAKEVTLKVELFDRGNAPSGVTLTNNPVTKYIQKNFGDPNHIKLQYIPVPRSQERSKLSVMMATSDVPDIVFTYDENLVYKYVTQGGLTDVGPYLNKDAPGLVKYLGKAVLNYGVFNGKQYAVPAVRADLGKYGELIRKDWLDKLNLPVPTTMEQLVSDLKAFKEKDPGHVGKNVIPYGFSLAPASYEPVIWPFIKNSSLTKEQYFTLSQPNNVPLLYPGHKKAVQFLNKLYNEGLMSPDFALDKDKKKLNQDIMTGRVGFYTEDLGSSYGIPGGNYENLEKNVKSARLEAVDTFTNSDGKHPKPLYDPNGMYIMIPKASKHVDAALKYLNWLGTDGLTFANYGEKGKSYKVDKNGLKVSLDTSEAQKYFFVLGDIHLVNNGVKMSPHDWAVARSPGHPEFVKPAETNYKDSLVDGFHYVRLPHPMSADTKYSSTLRQDYQQLLASAITAKPSDFSKVYDKYDQQYMQDGGKQVEQQRKAEWKKMNP